ncbi:MAG: hypothetical protein VX589_18275, partial [Myxococcota bacterium]|nr:hypothetical protein [Myxococcota bacterium]
MPWRKKKKKAAEDVAATVETKKSAKFPNIVRKFSGLNDLKQEAFADSFPGTVLSGKGKITEVSRCGFADNSEKWEDQCYKVLIDSGAPRIALYFGEKDKARIAELDKGDTFKFEECTAVSIKNW